MRHFGYKHSHQCKITNYFEAEEKNSIDIEQAHNGSKSGIFMKMRVKRLILMSPNITKGKRKKAGKNVGYANQTTT